MPESRSVIVAAVITAAATIAAAFIVIHPWDNGSTTPPSRGGGGGSASVFLSRDSGPGGAAVNVSGDGFSAGERVVIRFHTEQIASPTASSDGRFSNVGVVIPKSFSVFAPQQFDVVAVGDDSSKSARAPFTITG